MSTDHDGAARAARARDRTARMVIRKGTVGDDVDLAPVREAAGVALAVELSRVAWSLSGRPLPGPRQKPVTVTFERRIR